MERIQSVKFHESVVDCRRRVDRGYGNVRESGRLSLSYWPRNPSTNFHEEANLLARDSFLRGLIRGWHVSALADFLRDEAAMTIGYQADKRIHRQPSAYPFPHPLATISHPTLREAHRTRRVSLKGAPDLFEDVVTSEGLADKTL